MRVKIGGGYRYPYTSADLKHLDEWCRSRQPVYVFFNKLSMWADAQRFRQLWGGS